MKIYYKVLSYKEYIEKDILPNLDRIQEERVNGGTFKSVSGMLGIPLKSLHDIITRYAYIDNFNTYLNEHSKYTKEEKDNEKDISSQISRAWNVDDIRISMVEDALFKACFDHTLKYKVSMKYHVNKEREEIKEVEMEQAVPASYNAQRYFLISRKPEKWKNENKDIVNADSIAEKISNINVNWKPSKEDKNELERIKKMEEDIKNGTSN